MHVTLLNALLLPVPPVLGGPIERTLYETALGIGKPAMTVISPWSEALNGVQFDRKIFYHVDVGAQARQVRQALEQQARHRFVNRDTASQFYYLNGATDLLQTLNPDAIQVHNCAQFVPYLKREFPDKPVVLFLHNKADLSDGRVKLALKMSSHLLFVSHYLKDWLTSRYPEGAARARVIHNSVDTQRWTPSLKDHPKTEAIRQQHGLREGRTVLFVGRTVHEKGIHHLLDAMDLARRLVPGVKLLVVGSPLFGARLNSNFLRRLKRRAARMGDAVAFAGYVDPEETPYFYGASDVTVVPSVWDEPFGKVVIESLACGVPVVASRRGGISELVSDGEDGVLVDDPADVGLLAHGIVEVLLDANFRSALGKNGRRKAVRHFKNAVRIRRLRAFYQDLKREIEGGYKHRNDSD